MEEIKECTKCKGEMEKGIIADRSTNLSMKMQPQWGTYMTEFTLENSHNVETYRCKKCGYLESYGV